MLYFAVTTLKFDEQYALEMPIQRIFLYLREHISQTVPKKERKIVDLFTEETIDKLKKKMKKRINKYIAYDDYRPILNNK